MELGSGACLLTRALHEAVDIVSAPQLEDSWRCKMGVREKPSCYDRESVPSVETSGSPVQMLPSKVAFAEPYGIHLIVFLPTTQRAGQWPSAPNKWHNLNCGVSLLESRVQNFWPHDPGLENKRHPTVPASWKPLCPARPRNIISPQSRYPRLPSSCSPQKHHSPFRHHRLTSLFFLAHILKSLQADVLNWKL